MQNGLPDPQGTRAYVLATNASEPNVFYAATRSELYRSVDAGEHWQQLSVTWPDGFKLTMMNGMFVTNLP